MNEQTQGNHIVKWNDKLNNSIYEPGFHTIADAKRFVEQICMKIDSTKKYYIG